MADPAPELLLALLAVKLHGGKDVPEKTESLKARKKFIQEAIAHGWLAKGEFRPLNAKGKPGKAVIAISVTPAGDEYLQRSSSPEAAAVVAQARADEIRRAFEADRAALREQVLAAVEPSGSKGGKKEFADLSKAVSALAERLAKLEAVVSGPSATDIFAKIDSAFQAMTARLSPRTATQPLPPSPPSAATSHVPPAGKAPNIHDALRAAYDRRCLFVGNEDGVVKLADLFTEAKKTLPDLTVEAMHRELRTLWESRELELKVLNEVHDASEADKEKGIWRDGKLYYFIYWKRP